MTVNSKTEIICIMYKQDVDKFNTFILARKESYRYIIQNSFTSTVRSTKSTKPSKLMIENIKITTVHYYLHNSMAKIHSGFTKTYPRNTTTKGLLYTFSLCENIITTGVEGKVLRKLCTRLFDFFNFVRDFLIFFAMFFEGRRFFRVLYLSAGVIGWHARSDTLAPYIFIICLDYALRISLDTNLELGFTLQKYRYP